jgi:hypothetical protein
MWLRSRGCGAAGGTGAGARRCSPEAARPPSGMDVEVAPKPLSCRVPYFRTRRPELAYGELAGLQLNIPVPPALIAVAPTNSQERARPSRVGVALRTRSAESRTALRCAAFFAPPFGRVTALRGTPSRGCDRPDRARRRRSSWGGTEAANLARRCPCRLLQWPPRRRRPPLRESRILLQPRGFPASRRCAYL